MRFGEITQWRRNAAAGRWNGSRIFYLLTAPPQGSSHGRGTAREPYRSAGRRRKSWGTPTGNTGLTLEKYGSSAGIRFPPSAASSGALPAGERERRPGRTQENFLWNTWAGPAGRVPVYAGKGAQGQGNCREGAGPLSGGGPGMRGGLPGLSGIWPQAEGLSRLRDRRWARPRKSEVLDRSKLSL